MAGLEGIAELPLHTGHVPPWLIRVMEKLAHAILEIMVEEYGPNKIIERFSNPLWFQAFNNVIGMDWDSSGSTTVTTGILRQVTWNNPDLGFLVLGGKGSRARSVPQEVYRAVDLLGLDTDPSILARVSRLIAKIDSTLLQDHYTLYHHTLFISRDNRWCIVQQGMNLSSKTARRYHWIDSVRDMYSDPHKAVAGYRENNVLNLVASESEEARKTIIDLVLEKPEKIIEEYSRVYRVLNKYRSIEEYVSPTKTGIVIGDHIDRLTIYKPLPMPRDLLIKLRKIYSIEPANMDELLLIKGVGDKVFRALALISDLIYNEPPSTRDPVNTPYDPFKYSYAIGGKDGIPYPVNRRVAEEVIYTLEDIINRAKLGEKEKIRAFKNLSRIRFRVLGKYI